MFEAAILDIITVDTELTSYLSTHQGEPSMFFNSAPEKAEFNYLVFNIVDEGNEDDSVIDLFTVTFDIFGYSKSGAEIQDAAKRVVELFDRAHLTTSNYYDTIRLFKRGFMLLEKDDPRAQHYNVKFHARAGRSGWIDNLTT